MRRFAMYTSLFVTGLLLPSCTSTPRARTLTQARLTYPEAVRTAQVDDYHGTPVADPYRWLEETDSPESRTWIEAQNKITFGYLEEIPERPKLNQRLTELWNFEKYSSPFKKGGRYFLFKNDGLQNQSVLYTMTSLSSEPTVLLDPNKLSADGTVAFAGYTVSEDGNMLAYGLSTAGSDWEEWKVRDIRTGNDLPDHIKWAKWASASWDHHGKGFYYGRYDEPNEATKLKDVNYFHKLYYHKLGTPQSADVLVYHRPDQKEWGFGSYVTEDGQYLIISVSQGTDERNRVFYKDISSNGQSLGSPVVELIPDAEAAFSFIGNDGPVFWFQTDFEAPRQRVIAIDTRSPAKANWKEIIPQSTDTLRGTSVVHNQFLAQYLKDAHTRVEVFDLSGKRIREISLPGLGSAGGFGGMRTDTETFYSFETYSSPSTLYRYDLTKGTSEVFRAPKVAFDSSQYETKQVFYPSKDGTRVPMFITHKKGLKLNGDNPTNLYGYGGFNAAMTPSFSVTNLVWMEMGGVSAVANLRGGGEYGKEWHEAGMKLKKQNVFDDFIAAAEWLIANKYTRSDKLAISGGSNGGLLVGACLSQRPDLFGAALPAVGVMDMLRFTKFTIGWAWTSDYGSAEYPEEFKALYAYSPLHNLKPGTQYPATLVTTADHDDRVFPAHSFKFAAALQHAQAGEAPCLIRIDTKAGHGAGKPTAKRIEEAADRLAFLVRELQMDVRR